MNRVFENYREHPALKYDDHELVFKIDTKVYIIRESFISQIIITAIKKTNIGDPYRDLCRLCFVYVDDTDEYEGCVDFDFRFEDELKQLL